MLQTLQNTDLKKLTSSEIKAHFKAIDTMQLLNDNILYKMYKSGAIDSYLYRAFSIIFTYRLNNHDKKYNIVVPNKCRYKQLKRKFMHFYRLSNIKISLKLYDRIKKLIWDKVCFDEDKQGHKNTAYGNILHKQLVNAGKVEE